MTVIGLELYALLLSWSQGRVRTDEAKYLMDIPYPHPPLARWVLSLFDGFTWQAPAARILFATLVVQAVWIVWTMAKGLPKLNRLVACGSWLLAWGVASQAGAVMMAPLTALQALVFLWLFLRDEDATACASLIASFWLASLFTAYQIALFFPLVLALFWKMKLPQWQRLLLFVVPVVLLCLYTLTNPFALASMLNQAGQDAAEPLAHRAGAAALLWLLSGSVVLSIAGLYGLIRSRRVPILLSFLLVFAYVAAGFHTYYIVLFVPLSIAGLLALLKLYPRLSPWYGVSLAVACAWLAVTSVRWPMPSAASVTMRMIEVRGKQGSVLLQGSFGHEWQYESRLPVLKYGEWLLPDAQAVVCLADACDVRGIKEFEKLENAPVETWVRD